MFARSTTLTGDPTALDAGIAYVRDDVMPAINAIDGCVGLSMMVDRESGQCITTSSWSAEAAMQASAPQLTPLRGRLAEIIGGSVVVQEWEIEAMHRDHLTHKGTCCRVTWLRTDHADVDRGVDIYKNGVLPELEKIKGFCSASLMVNRTLSRACATASYDTMAALDASREQAWAIRDSGVREAGVDVIDAAELELAIAHLRLPELI